MELIVVLVIISIISFGGWYLYYGKRINKARTAKTEETIKALERIIAGYYSDTGRLPSSAKQLWSNDLGTPGWYGPYAEPPNGDYSLDRFIHTPWLGDGWLECSDGSYERLKMQTNQEICQLLDKDVDDGNQASGLVRWDGTYCYYYFRNGSSVRCG